MAVQVRTQVSVMWQSPAQALAATPYWKGATLRRRAGQRCRLDARTAAVVGTLHISAIENHLMLSHLDQSLQHFLARRCDVPPRRTALSAQCQKYS